MTYHKSLNRNFVFQVHERDVFRKSTMVHKGSWPKTAAGAHEVRGKTIGIVVRSRPFCLRFMRRFSCAQRLVSRCAGAESITITTPSAPAST